MVLTATEPFATQLRTAGLSWYKYDCVWVKTKSTFFVHAKNRPLRAFENVLVFSKGAMNHASMSDRRMTYNPQMKEGKPYTGHSDPQTKFGTIVGKRPSHTATSTINTGERYPTDVLEFPSESDTIHPTQKPVALFEYLIRTYTQEGDTVLDMTCGSGTTAVACVRSNRHFICGDLSEEYVNLARNRLASTDPYQDKPVKGGGKQLSLFGGDNG